MLHLSPVRTPGRADFPAPLRHQVRRNLTPFAGEIPMGYLRYLGEQLSPCQHPSRIFSSERCSGPTIMSLLHLRSGEIGRLRKVQVRHFLQPSDNCRSSLQDISEIFITFQTAKLLVMFPSTGLTSAESGLSPHHSPPRTHVWGSPTPLPHTHVSGGHSHHHLTHTCLGGFLACV